MGWDDKKEVKKGKIGEQCAKMFLEEKGFTVYKPITNGSHKIDYFAHHGNNKNVIALEAKTKKRMAKMCKTGFNYDNYLHYKEIEEKHNIPTYIFFVDDFEECIYGQWLDKLGEGQIIKNVIVWPLEKMNKIRDLLKEEIEELKKNSAKDNYDYTAVKPYFKKAEEEVMEYDAEYLQFVKELNEIEEEMKPKTFREEREAYARRNGGDQMSLFF